MNYFVGLNLSGGNYFLAADFEEGTGQASPGLNHPVVSATPIAGDTWYHAAATYDASIGTFRLYLNGVEQINPATPIGAPLLLNAANRAPQVDSTQHAAIGTAARSQAATSAS